MGISRNIKYYFRRIKKIDALEKPYKKTKPKVISTIEKKELIFNTSSNPIVSIIIPFYNEENYTWNCLNYLYKNLSTKYPYEIILIDDNSPEENSLDTIKGISIIKNDTNLGFLRNVNKGIELSKGEYIYLLNNDTEVQAHFLDELFYVFENFKNVGAVGSMLTNSDGSLQEAGSVFMANCNINQIVRKKLPFYPEVNYIYKVDYCSGCSLLFKKHNDNGTINLFDEQFIPAYFEETDFCFQLKFLQNKDIYYTPFSKVLHYNGVTYNSKKNTDENKLKKKEELFKTNLQKFKNKWQIQLNAIKSTSIPDRVQEIYNTKSVVIFPGMIPEFDKDSGSNRLKEIINAFIDLKYHVTLVAKYTYKENPYIEYFQRKGVNVFYEHKKYTSIEKYLEKQKTNASIAWFYSPEVFMKRYKIAKKYLPNAKLVYDMVDIHHLRIQRSIELEPKLLSLRIKYIRNKKKEIQSARLADYVVAISDFEANYMTQFCNKSKLITISNIHYTKIKIEDTLSFEDRNNILFIGSTHTPNIDALYYLYNDIMPIVWEKLPNLKVNIIGNVKESIDDIHDSRFIFHGYVPDIKDYFISNKLMIAPLRYGAGVKGKIGQAFEYFLPIVTSSIGAEGMNLINKENALINDTKEGFAEAILQLYTDKELWSTLQKSSENSLKPFSIEHLKETLINGLEINDQGIIKIGYLVSYDYKFIFSSLNEVYPYADKIVLCYDKNFKTWSGNNFKIPKSFFDEIKKLDVDNKIHFYEDIFYIENYSPMELETKQRNMLAQFLGKGGWHIQIDSDEYPYDFEKIITFLKSNNFLLKNPEKTPVNFLVKWIVLFKENSEGYFIIKPFKETCYMITNNPEYTYARKTDSYNIVLDNYAIHQSWARNEDEVYTKLINWGHKNDFDTISFYENWKELNQNNYNKIINFHPIYGTIWRNLEFQKAKNIHELIEICKTKYPQKKLKIKLTKRLKLYFKYFT